MAHHLATQSTRNMTAIGLFRAKKHKQYDCCTFCNMAAALFAIRPQLQNCPFKQYDRCTFRRGAFQEKERKQYDGHQNLKKITVRDKKHKQYDCRTCSCVASLHQLLCCT